ncbi:hypothetical protein [uncultured Sphingomonas sp.]|uniref:hypothetical protein n=1 Tax=uncultured Sphingomonas sp. TaxID=158754 RepID=UPI0025DF46F9|nr:hypothetical protein [uncultured Sphingomonas sp.]
MTGRTAIVTRWGIATLGSSCTLIGTSALVGWIMDDRLVLPLARAWRLTAGMLIGGAFGSLVLLGILAVARRIRPVGPWSAGAIGALLFCLPLSLLSFRPDFGLLAAPAGFVAGILLARVRSMTRVGAILMGGGLLFWIVWVALAAIEQSPSERAPLAGSGSTILGTDIVGGVTFGSELWLLDDIGRMASYRLEDWRPTRRSAAGVTAIAADGAHVWALQAAPLVGDADDQPAGRFRLAVSSGGPWRYSARQDYGRGEPPLALTLGQQGPVVIGPKALYLSDAKGGFARRSLNEPIKPWGQFIALMVGRDTLYLGANRGEWGGGLLRISVSSGRVSPVERIDGTEICSGPLSGGCDPVTGLIHDPDHPSCVLASIGLSHMLEQGRVLRVCAQHVETVWQAQILPLGMRIRRALSPHARRFSPETEPVFALLPAPGGFWAVTPRALYHANRGAVERHDFPDLHPVRGLMLSTSIPGIIVAQTEANGRYALSGATPLIFSSPSAATPFHRP